MTVEEWMKSREKLAIASGLEKGMKQGLEKGMKEGLEQGMTKGKAESVLQLLEEHGTIPKQLTDEILAQTDAEVLTGWLKLAAKVTSLEEFRQKM